MNHIRDTAANIKVDRAAIRLLKAEEILSLYAHWLEREIVFRETTGLEVLPLKTYYRNLFSPHGKIRPIGWEGYGQRLTPIIEELKTSTRAPRVLDAGCGYGTESLLFSLFPAKVWGVDLVPERIALARSRADFFQALSNKPLELTFVNAHLFRFLETSPPFDIIWALEAISHIYPPEKFLRLCWRKINKDGKLIISDPNSLNPLALLRSMKIRGSVIHRPHQKFLDPDTWQPADVGQEKIFNIFRIKKLLEAAGFRIQAVEMSGFMGSSLLPQAFFDKEKFVRSLERYQKLVRRIPLLRSLGSIYTLIATKRND